MQEEMKRRSKPINSIQVRKRNGYRKDLDESDVASVKTSSKSTNKFKSYIIPQSS